jgi:NO-binding membrane sensor protein with MHYT domain
MNHVLACLLEQHDLKLLPIAVGLALLATTTSFLMAMRARAADGLRQRAAWIVGSGLEAGAGIWATHFVAMLAYRSGLPISFDPGLTALSAATWCGASESASCITWAWPPCRFRRSRSGTSPWWPYLS